MGTPASSRINESVQTRDVIMNCRTCLSIVVVKYRKFSSVQSEKGVQNNCARLELMICEIKFRNFRFCYIVIHGGTEKPLFWTGECSNFKTEPINDNHF